jgi:hypothetical protein
MIWHSTDRYGPEALRRVAERAQRQPAASYVGGAVALACRPFAQRTCAGTNMTLCCAWPGVLAADGAQGCRATNGNGNTASASVPVPRRDVPPTAGASVLVPRRGVPPYSEVELEAVIEKALTLRLSGVRSGVSFDQIFKEVGRDPRAAAAGRAAVMRALDAMGAANKVMIREGRVHIRSPRVHSESP